MDRDAFKHYIYISDAKVKMMFPQIPQSFWRKLRMSVKLKFPGGSELKLEERDVDPVIIHKLQEICKYLNDKGLIGEAGSNTPYFRGTMDTMTILADPGVVFWIGYYDDGIPPKKKRPTIICLGGSISHVLGANVKKMLAKTNKSVREKLKMDSPEICGHFSHIS